MGVLDKPKRDGGTVEADCGLAGRRGGQVRKHLMKYYIISYMTASLRLLSQHFLFSFPVLAEAT
jgi:hypothetical protein